MNFLSPETSQTSNFRPPSLSIITVTSELQKSLQSLRDNFDENYEQIFLEENDDDNIDAREKTFQRIHRINSIKTFRTNKLNALKNASQDDGVDVNDVESSNASIHTENSLLKYYIAENNSSFHNQVHPPSILKQLNFREDDRDSIGDCSIANVSDMSASNAEHNQEMQRLMNDRLVKLLSIMYCIVIIFVGVIITMGDMERAVNDRDHLYSIIINTVSIVFLAFMHIDIQKHKKLVIEWHTRSRETTHSQSSDVPSSPGTDFDSVSVTTAAVFNRNYDLLNDNMDHNTKTLLNGYKFVTGKHSGNFYLKCGITLFCMGSIVHQGVFFVIQVHYFSSNEQGCKNYISLIVYLIRCISAFYQLYMIFKYSNLIINKNLMIVRFGLMHLVGSAMAFWFSTIIEEAMEGYFSKVTSTNETLISSAMFHNAIEHHTRCTTNALNNFESFETMPLLYPFSIEFSIGIASMFYIIWSRIADHESHSQISHISEEINENKSGQTEVNYRSNLAINADCHASNLGLFGGLFSLLIILTTTVVFFMTIKSLSYKNIGINLYTGQLGFLTVCSLVTVPLAFRHTRNLNVVKVHHMDNPSTSMDDFLLLAPLPFYYVHHILCIVAELNCISLNGIILAIIYACDLVQVTCQTPFLVDAIRRCSNSRKMRFKKPGKGLITFALIINITIWILITFEIKSVDKYHSMADFFGKFVWMIILDSCLPLMLFYRFHSSVVLSDVHQGAYLSDTH